MPGNIHFVPVGSNSIKLHLAGLARYKADEVVLFSRKGDSKVEAIVDSLRKIGMSYRVAIVGRGYIDPYRKANEEAAAYLTDDTSLGINMSTGSDMLAGAVEDGVRIQLNNLHQVNEYADCAAYRYYILVDKGVRFEVAPLWNSFLYLHNDILEVLADSPEALSVNEILDAVRELNPNDALGFEAFRKVFRTYKRWFGRNPCFKEKLQKAPKYKVDL